MADTFARMRQLTGTTSQWSANNLILALGEIGVETGGTTKLKVGNGTSTWSALPYTSAVGDITGVTAGTGLSGGGTTGTVSLSVNFAVVAALASPAFTGTPTAPTPTGTPPTTRIATVGWVSSQVGAYVPLIGGVTISGAITITGILTTNSNIIVDRPLANANVDVRSASGNVAHIITRTDTTTRWAFGKDPTVEGTPGSNIGANFWIRAYDDAGAPIENALAIARSDRSAVFSGAVTAPTYNKVTITAPATGATITMQDASVLSYEEGSFTPTAAFAVMNTCTIAYGTRLGFYQKVGVWVTASMNITFTPTYGVTPPTGDLRLDGLPYAAGSEYGGSISYNDADLTWPTGTTHVLVCTVTSATYVIMRGIKTAASPVEFAPANLVSGNSHTIRLVIRYRVAGALLLKALEEQPNLLPAELEALDVD